MRAGTIEDSLLGLRQLDLLAAGDSTVHRLDPRVKLLAAFGFVLVVVSFDRYTLSGLLPFFFIPLAVCAMAGLPVGLVVRMVLPVVPFAVLIGAANPLLDHAVQLQLGSIGISGGWFSFASIVVRALLCTAAAILLVAVTGVPAIGEAMGRLGAPQALVVQLLFMYRYLFVLGEEAAQASRARALRSFGRRGMGPGPFAAMIGHLLLRSWERAERIHQAMLARGFTGQFRSIRRYRFGLAELATLLLFVGTCLLLRLVNLPQLVGTAALGLLQGGN